VSWRKSGKPRLAAGEGWGEGVRALVRAWPLTRSAPDDASHRQEQIDPPTGER